MILSDLLFTLHDFVNKSGTMRSVNVFLEDSVYDIIFAQAQNKVKKLYEINAKDQYFHIGQFTIINNSSSANNKPLEKNHCYINADIGGGIFRVLTENERIIKDIIE